MDWEKQVVRRTLEGAGEYPGVQLQILLRHLEACPDALPFIADAAEAMGEWHKRHAEELRDEVLRRRRKADLAVVKENGGAE